MPNRDPNGDLSASHAFGANLIAMPTLILFAHPSSADAGGRDAAADLSRRQIPSWSRSGVVGAPGRDVGLIFQFWKERNTKY